MIVGLAIALLLGAMLAGIGWVVLNDPCKTPPVVGLTPSHTCR